MAQVQQVAPPGRKPRSGGIKSIVGSFVDAPRLPAASDIVWEGSGCGFPSETRAGCYDTVTPLVYDDVVVTDNGDVFTFSREGNTVTVEVTFGAGVPAGFTAPWNPIIAVNESVTGGAVVITTGGAGSQTGTPTGVSQFIYTTTGTAGGYYADKIAEGVSQYSAIGPIFARYAGVECFIGGDTDGNYESQATELLEAGEDRAVEAVLWAWADGASTPGTATTIAAAIAAAEEHADVTYVGLPVLLMSRASATLAYAAHALTYENGTLYTANGVPVLATGAADASEVIAIGWPAVYANSVTAITAIKHTENLAMAIAERVYALGVDCDYRYKVTVTP